MFMWSNVGTGGRRRSVWAYGKYIWIAMMASLIAYGCDDGASSNSSLNDPECVLGQKACTEDNKGKKLCATDGWTEYACPDGQTCKDGECSSNDTPGPNDDTPGPQKECEMMIGSCVGSVATRCEEGKLVEEDCEAKGQDCSGGQCMPRIKMCDPEEYEVKCHATNSARIVCEEGTEVEKPCDAGEICANGVCQMPQETCEENNSECTGDKSLKKCVDGAWHSQTCEGDAVCIEGACELPTLPDSCLGNEPVCLDNKTRIICNNSTRETADCDIDNVCTDGECMTPVTPGSSCDDDFSPYCLDDTHVARCLEDTVTSVKCPEDHICKAGVCVNKPCGDDFVPECKSDTEARVCESGVVKVQACDPDLLCVNGICRELQEGDNCTAEEFSNVCLDKSSYLSCGSEGTIEKKTCTDGVCLNGMCSECDPDNFEVSCDSSDDTKNSYLTCVEDEKTPGLYVKKPVACPKSEPVCFEGACVECDPEHYKPHCTGSSETKCSAEGKLIVTPCTSGFKCVTGFDVCTNQCSSASDCPTRDDGLTYKCESNNCVLQTQCNVSTDKPTCSGDKRKVCQDPGKWVEESCASGKVCTGQGECVACTKNSHCASGKVCNTSTHTCVQCNVNSDCASNICLNHQCAECNPATYGTEGYKCHDDHTLTTCTASNKIIYMTCPDNGPVCVDDMCHPCNGHTDAGTKTCDFPGYEGKELTCQPDHKMAWRNCPDNETCSGTKGCISKCGESFAPTCANDEERYVCDNSGNKVKESCWPGLCKDGKCTNKCSGNIDKCGDYNGSTVFRTCIGTTVVAYEVHAKEFCGTINGTFGLHKKCSANEFSIGLDSAGECVTYNCVPGQTYNGANTMGFWPSESGAACQNERTMAWCYKTKDGSVMLRKVDCAVETSKKCESNGVCTGMSKIDNPSFEPPFDGGTCFPGAGKSAVLLNYYPVGKYWYPHSFDCMKFKSNAHPNPDCVVHVDDYGRNVAACNHTYDYGDGVVHKISGTCVGNQLYQLHLSKTSQGYTIETTSQTCTKCKTTSTGWAYCGQ